MAWGETDVCTLLNTLCKVLEPYLPKGDGGVLPIGNTSGSWNFDPKTLTGFVQFAGEISNYEISARVDVKKKVVA